MPIFWLGVVAAVIASVVYVIRTKDPAKRSRFLRKAGLILMGAFSTFLALFIAGDTFTDPGGWVAVGYVALWAVPIALLAALAWFRPSLATIVFAGLIVGMFGLFVWSAIAADAWSEYEDSVGPVRTIVAFAIAAPLALLGWKRPFAAGVMLLLLAVPSAILTAAGGGAISVTIFVATSPASVTGILYLLAARFERRGKGPPEAVDGGSLPKAA
jgi:hypothetical protein